MNSLKKNIIYQMLYEILILIIPIITAPYISRILGADKLGIYSYTYNIANYFVLFAALGIRNYGNREISRVKDNKKRLDQTFSSILILHLIIAAAVTVVYFVIVLRSNGEYRVYELISGLYVLGAFFDISWLFMGLEEFKMTVTRNTVIRISSVLCIFLFVKTNNDLWIYILILALSNLVSQLYLWFFIKKRVRLVKVSKNDIFQHLPQLVILFIPTIAISLYNNMDKIMVGSIAGVKQLGFYENSEKIVFVAISVIGAVGTVMLPRMSNVLAKGQNDKGKQYIFASMQLVMCISYALTFGIIAVSYVFAPVFWGKEFQPCSPLLIGLAVTLPVKAFANVLRTQFLIPSRKDKEYTISVCSGAFANFILNLFFIKQFGAMGAVIATIIAEVVVCVVQIYYCWRELPILNYIKFTTIYFIFGIVMMVPLIVVGIVAPQNFLTLCIQIIFGALIYIVLVLLHALKTHNMIYQYLHTFIGKFHALKK